MAETKDFPIISAKDSKEFAEIEKAIKTLPESIIAEIEKVQYGLIGLECTVRNVFSGSPRYIFPNWTSQISNFDDYIGVYAGDFFFKIPQKKEYKQNITFVFVDKNGKLNGQ